MLGETPECGWVWLEQAERGAGPEAGAVWGVPWEQGEGVWISLGV